MEKTDIINTLAKQRFVEKIVSKYDIKFKEDLSQMVYLWLLEKPDELIQQLWQSSQLNFYIASIVKTQVCSTKSKYYRDFVYSGLPLEEAIEVNIPEKYTLLDELANHIDNLPNEEREMLYSSISDVVEDREITRNKLMLTKCQYADRLKKLKKRICSDMGGDVEQLKKYYSQNKKVCISTGDSKIVFDSVREASKFVGLSEGVVRKYCGDRRYCKGFYYKYMY